MALQTAAALTPCLTHLTGPTSALDRDDGAGFSEAFASDYRRVGSAEDAYTPGVLGQDAVNSLRPLAAMADQAQRGRIPGVKVHAGK